ncbi:MAG: SdpI family protein [Oscillospiraceae bacterium]|nr:SdpI family protein [Oscillospiraceae bacterium]
MKPRNNVQIILSTIVCLVPIVLTLALYKKLPEQVPIHFDMNGVPDNYASKAIAGFLFPVLLAAFNVFVHFMMNSDPKKQNANKIIRLVGFWIFPVVSLITVPMTLFKGLNYDVPVVTICTAMIGLLFLIIGNYLPKSRQSYTVGIRLPWTLDNEENWNKTHRFGGFVWVLGGLVEIVSAFVRSYSIQFAVIALVVILPIAYSYLLFRKQIKDKEPKQ